MAIQSDFRPKLRAVDTFAAQVKGQKMVGLTDPARVASETILLSMGAIAVMTMMDGTRDLTDIQAALAGEGAQIDLDVITQLVESLDEHLFLDSPRYQAAALKIEADFTRSSERAPLLAGRAYESDPAALRVQLAGFYTQQGGPGAKTTDGRVTPRALIAPHIDPPRGGPVYAHAYGTLAASPAQLVIVLGTSHTGTGFYFTLTRKDYQTPLGPVRTDAALVDRLAAEHGQAVFTGEIAHRSEHSLEFAALWLRHEWPGHDFAVLPILCGAGHEALMKGGSLADDPAYERCIESLRQIARERPTLVLASADLSHMGPRFGDHDAQQDAQRAKLETEDRRMLECIARGDAEAFRANVWDEKDRRKVCGFLPIYALLRIMDGAPGRLLAYTQWPDPAAVVSYAAVSFP